MCGEFDLLNEYLKNSPTTGTTEKKQKMKMKIEIEIDMPDGFEFIEWSHAVTGEYYLTDLTESGIVRKWVSDTSTIAKYVIVRKIREWLPIDLSKVTMSMLPLAARFRNKDMIFGGWSDGFVIGIVIKQGTNTPHFIDAAGDAWDSCKVLSDIE